MSETPQLDASQLRFTLGLKLKTLRQKLDLPLKEVARRSGLAISYLSEIEKGKKYPKPEKLLHLARALGVPFDELVSPQVSDALGAAKEVFGSEFFREFPFELFGVEPADVFGLITEHPERAGALARTFLEVGRLYDVHVEQFLLAALRSYQELHRNYFADLEASAAAFRAQRLGGKESLEAEDLARVLVADWGYLIEDRALQRDPALNRLRSVYAEGSPPRLHLNGRLLPSQRAFVLAREIGYRHLGLGERVVTSNWLRVDSWEQVLNNFKASYFAGALLIDGERLTGDLERLFARRQFDGEAWLAVVRRHRATPEMFFHRLTEILPQRFGLAGLYFMRFTHQAGAGRAAAGDPFRLTKVFNLSRVPVPHGVGLDETYCRRWPPLRLLAGADARPRRRAGFALRLDAERVRFLDEGAEFLTLTSVRPLSLTDHAGSAVSLGLLLDETLTARVRFWNDPRLPRTDVNLTCERCRLSRRECRERAAPPVLWQAQERQREREAALATLLAGDAAS